MKYDNEWKRLKNLPRPKFMDSNGAKIYLGTALFQLICFIGDMSNPAYLALGVTFVVLGLIDHDNMIFRWMYIQELARKNLIQNHYIELYNRSKVPAAEQLDRQMLDLIYKKIPKAWRDPRYEQSEAQP